MIEPATSPDLDQAYRADRGSSEGDREIRSGVYRLAVCLVAVAAAWFLLKEWAALMRPLVLAVFLAYIVVPIHRKLSRRISAPASAIVIIGGTLVLFWGVSMMVYASIIELNADLPHLIDRARAILARAESFGHSHLPRWLRPESAGLDQAELRGWNSLRATMRSIASAAALTMSEAFLVGVYLVFLIMESRVFPQRIRAGFEAARAEKVLAVIARINVAMGSYLRAKVISSLVTALPTAFVLWAFGVKFALMWGVLTFLGNFIPYIGALIAFTFPVLLAFLSLEPVWQPCTVVVLLILIQVITNNFVEPTLMGKAVDLSPLVTLIALAFWGLCWGVTGMLLAVPLTAMLKITGESLAGVRPFTFLLGETIDTPGKTPTPLIR